MSESDESAAGPTPPTPKRKRRLGCQTISLLLLAVLCLGAGWAYWKWSRRPAEARRIDRQLTEAEPAERRRLAMNVEQAIRDLLSDPPPTAQAAPAEPSTGSPTPQADAAEGQDDPVVELTRPAAGPDADPRTFVRDVHLTVEETNAWIRDRLPEWMANQGKSLPSELSDMHVWVENDRLAIGFQVTTPKLDQFFSGYLDVEVLPDGRCRTTLTQIRGGDLPIPSVRAIVDRMRQSNTGGQRTLAKIAELLDGQTFDPTRVVGDRRLTLLGFELEDGEIRMKVRSEPK